MGVLLFIMVPIIVAALSFLHCCGTFFHVTHTRSVTTDVVQGIFVGFGLAVITVLVILPTFYVTQINGWTTMFGCGEPRQRPPFLRAACNVTFRGPINIPQEAMYWTTSKDGLSLGHRLSGTHDYTLRFAAGTTSAQQCVSLVTHYGRRGQSLCTEYY